jgi:SnoaL-like domain
MTREQENTTSFHIADFVAWNNREWEMQRRYHTEDVVVYLGGQRTEGIEPHIEAMRRALAAFPGARVVQHDPNVAEGEWTATVGLIVPQDLRVATVARWRDGRIAEEYVFMRQLPAGDATSEESSAPVIAITNPDDDELHRVAGVEPGWSCLVHSSSTGSRTATFAKRVDGRIVEQVVFADV